MHTPGIPVFEALAKLKVGNEKYINAKVNPGDVSAEVRLRTMKEGQKPFATIITCADSRVIPEAVFSAGIGELFVIRVAGNVIDDHQLGSIEYAAQHLGTLLVVVLGHTNCGAVKAAILDNADGYVKYITDDIQEAIGDETDDYRATCLNVQHSIARINECELMRELETEGISVMGAVYHIDTGVVEFLQD